MPDEKKNGSGTEIKNAENSTTVWPPPSYQNGDRWDIWKIQLNMYITSRGITDDRIKVMALLQHIGKDTLGKIVDWKSPSDPLEESFANLITLLDSKFLQGENLFALRVQLFNESQLPDQPIQEYFAHMTQLIGKCKFTSKEENGVLAILRGLASNELRQFLMLPTNDISTIDKLQSLAMSYEQSCIASKDVIKGKSTSNIEKIKPETNHADEKKLSKSFIKFCLFHFFIHSIFPSYQKKHDIEIKSNNANDEDEQK